MVLSRLDAVSYRPLSPYSWTVVLWSTVKVQHSVVIAFGKASVIAAQWSLSSDCWEVERRYSFPEVQVMRQLVSHDFLLVQM